jgi:hypothetical protein
MKRVLEEHREHYYAFQSGLRNFKAQVGKEATRYSSAYRTCIPLLLFEEYYLIKIEVETCKKFLDLNNHIYQNILRFLYDIISYDPAQTEISFVFINYFSKNKKKKKKGLC